MSKELNGLRTVPTLCASDREITGAEGSGEGFQTEMGFCWVKNTAQRFDYYLGSIGLTPAKQRDAFPLRGFIVFSSESEMAIIRHKVSEISPGDLTTKPFLCHTQ